MLNKKDKVFFQPYGKDEFYINLVSDDDFWVFGPCDTDNFDPINKNSPFHSYIKISGKNPRYYNKNQIDKNFKLKKTDKVLKVGNSGKKTENVNELYVFIVYNYKDQFVHLNYTPIYEEFCEIEKNFNVMGSMFIIGEDLSVVGEQTSTGMGISVENVEEIILDIKKQNKEEDS